MNGWRGVVARLILGALFGIGILAVYFVWRLRGHVIPSEVAYTRPANAVLFYIEK